MPIHLIFANQLDSCFSGCSCCPIMLQICLNLIRWTGESKTSSKIFKGYPNKMTAKAQVLFLWSPFVNFIMIKKYGLN